VSGNRVFVRRSNLKQPWAEFDWPQLETKCRLELTEILRFLQFGSKGNPRTFGPMVPDVKSSQDKLAIADRR